MCAKKVKNITTNKRKKYVFTKPNQTKPNQTKLIIAIALSSATFQVVAAPCDSNFTSAGNLITGTTYKTFAELPNVNTDSAYQGAYADIAKEPSWKILSGDKANGVIQVVQAESYALGKTIPLNIVIEAINNGAKVSMTYATPPATLSPESAIKSQFCQTIQSAQNSVGDTTSNDESDKTKPIQQDATNHSEEIKDTSSNGSMERTEFVKNGLPCVAEVCLADGLKEMRKVKWDKINMPYSSKDKEIGVMVKKQFRGKLKDSIPYLYIPLSDLGQFDNRSLSTFDEVIADCGNETHWIGKYTTSSGNPTQVTIALLPNQDNTKQSWTVIEISRRYPKAITKEQQQKIRDELAKRYGSSDSLKMLGKKTTNEYIPTHSLSGSHLGLTLSTNSDITNRQKLHPDCGGKSKVEID